MRPKDDAAARSRDVATDAVYREGIAATARGADIGVQTLRAFLASGRSHRPTLAKLWRWASVHGDEQLRELAAAELARDEVPAAVKAETATGPTQSDGSAPHRHDNGTRWLGSGA